MSGNILLLSTSNFVIKTNKPNCTDMTTKTALPLIALLCLCMQLSAQPVSKRQLQIKRTAFPITIDGELKEEVWKTAPMADKFTEFQPTPFKPEEAANGTQFYFLYNNEGIYVGGYCHERNKDSISAELIGRDGFGNNDFVGFVFDTYNDKLNGFEYFVTPLGEQMDAKSSQGGNEDFSWNAVWKSASKLQPDGWSFEIFLPYSAIRFGKKKVQDWGLNLVRRRQKSGKQLFWQQVDPNINGFLTQAGLLVGLEDIKPPLRLQFSPYFSTYLNHDGTASADVKKTTTQVNGGMDVKYGINQAFTLDMTLIPDFGQVQSDNRVLNLSPFEQRFTENRTFFTEGTELFNKGNLFYSRRIGGQPIRYGGAYSNLAANERVIENPAQSKLVNATKISGRTQKGLGVGILNAITKPQYAKIEDNNGHTRKYETDPLTNYNVLVLDQTFKHNSSLSFVNTNVWRSGNDYDANVSSLLFDLNDKTNTWNVGGSLGVSALLNKNNRNEMGYTHSLYFGKTSGRFTFNFYHELVNDKYDKSDMGYFTNNNTMDQSFFFGYNWSKPVKWYNQLRMNINGWNSRLVTPLDEVKGRDRMTQGSGINFNVNGQLKNLWWVGGYVSGATNYNDFYEPRVRGRVFDNRGRIGAGIFWNSNSAKKLSWGGNIDWGEGGAFTRKTLDWGLFGKIRFNSKFSIDNSIMTQNSKDQPGWADILPAATAAEKDTVIFSRRNLRSVENMLNLKYSFTNRMGLTLRVRHYWSKVEPVQFYKLNTDGKLVTPDRPYTGNRNQNYNYLSVDMVYTWQFAQGSFFNIVWKDIGESFTRSFEKNYFKNAQQCASGPQFNSLSLRLIYFLDYLTLKNKNKKA